MNNKPPSHQQFSTPRRGGGVFLSIKQIVYLAYLAIEFPPSPQPWDDFLDFSRMKVPQDFWTVSCRLERNLYYQFQGNYFVLWVLGMIIAGAFIDYLFLFSLLFLIIAWLIICITSVNPIHWHLKSSINTKKNNEKQKYVGMENERHIVLFAVGHIGFFFLGILGRIYLITSILATIVFSHAILRPVAMELMRKKPIRIIASDGFLDDQEEDQNDGKHDGGQEEILLFSKEEKDSTTTIPKSTISTSTSGNRGIIRRFNSTTCQYSSATTSTITSSNRKKNVIGVMMISNHLDDDGDGNIDAPTSDYRSAADFTALCQSDACHAVSCDEKEWDNYGRSRNCITPSSNITGSAGSDAGILSVLNSSASFCHMRKKLAVHEKNIYSR